MKTDHPDDRGSADAASEDLRSADFLPVDDGPERDDARTRRALRLVERAERRCRLFELRSIERLLERADALAGSDASLQPRILSVRVMLARIEARYDDAMRHAKRAAELWKARGDVVAQIDLRIEVARILMAVGSSEDALREGLAALEEAEGLEARTLRLQRVAEATRVLGTVYINVGQFERSIAFCERAAEGARLIGDVVLEGSLLDLIGCSYGTMAHRATTDGEHARAGELLEQALHHSRQGMLLARQGGNRRNEATALANLAESLVHAGRPEEALTLMETWSSEPIDDIPHVAAHHLDTHGTICMALGRYDEAVALFEEAFRKSAVSNMALVACEHLAEACERAGDLRAALTYFKRFHALFRQMTSDAAQRSASVAAVHLETQQARANADRHRTIAEGLLRSNENLMRRADDLMRLSDHDPLTGLANRRLMERLLEERVGDCGIVMIDVDRFKTINDEWSHLVGDAVLRQVAESIRHGCRDADTPVRYGGDEFAIVLKDGDERSTLAAGERVRAAVEAFDWSVVAAGLRVSVSVGCASMGVGRSASDTMILADRCLYEAKRGGRNRVVGGPGEARH